MKSNLCKTGFRYQNYFFPDKPLWSPCNISSSNQDSVGCNGHQYIIPLWIFQRTLRKVTIRSGRLNVKYLQRQHYIHVRHGEGPPPHTSWHHTWLPEGTLHLDHQLGCEAAAPRLGDRTSPCAPEWQTKPHQNLQLFRNRARLDTQEHVWTDCQPQWDGSNPPHGFIPGVRIVRANCVTGDASSIKTAMNSIVIKRKYGHYTQLQCESNWSAGNPTYNTLSLLFVYGEKGESNVPPSRSRRSWCSPLRTRHT